MDDVAACKNTDVEIWREREGDFYSPSIHVTEGGGIGLDVGGHVIVKPIRDWHNLAEALAAAIQARDLYHNQRDRAQMELRRALGSIRFCEHSGSRLDAPLPVPPIDLMNPEFE